jgi:hypothetical protein
MGRHDLSQKVPTARVPEHELVRCIDEGSFGEVWLARTVIDRYRAAKIVHRQNFEDARPFEREFAGVRKFEPISRTHPGLVAILQVGPEDKKDYFYYVMEIADDLVRGEEIDPGTYLPKTLREYLRQKGRVAVGESLRVAIALADALAHIHEKGLVHRDIKPSNIIFVQGEPKFADIGLVTRIEEATGKDGTFGYVPQEGPGAPTADVYAFGKVLYQMALGKGVRDYPELPVQLDEWEDTPQLIQINEIIRKCCEQNARLRFQTARDLQAALERVRATLPEATPKRKTTVVATADKKPSTRKRRVRPPRLNFRVVILYSPAAESDRDLARFLSERLFAMGFDVDYDKGEVVGIEWVQESQERLAGADAAVVLISAASAQSETLAHEVELAYQAAQQQRKPRLIPVRLQYTEALPPAMAGILDSFPAYHWMGPGANDRLVENLGHALEESIKSVMLSPPRIRLESVGGAVPPGCRFYVERPTDDEFQNAVARRDSIVLVKGARQMGKTSLLARGLEQARKSGAQVVSTDFQKLNDSHLASIETLFLSLAEYLADQMELDVFAADFWDKRRSPNTNFERYLKKHVLAATPNHLVWGLDEVDRLFGCPFASEVFGLFRSWHNERALNPSGPWSRLTLVMAYATEAHLFISDLNQSPFNVGTRLTLQDFSMKEVAELNRRYDMPLRTEAELKRLYGLLGGQPYLVRRALNELASGNISLDKLIETADRDDGIFGDHLRRMLMLLGKDSGLFNSVSAVLRGDSHSDTTAFYRLRSAGIMDGESVAQLHPRCELYANHLKKHLGK